jgi:hypothetical protein
MNRVKHILTKLWYSPQIYKQIRKNNKQKFNQINKNNFMKINKRQYHSYNNNPPPNMEPNKNNLILLGISLLLLDGFYNKIE